jgi:hypothetical protein
MALNTLQGYNSNSPRRTSLQRVFVRPKHLYTRRPLSLPRTAPLYTFAAATCRSAPHLRHRNSSRSRPGRVVPLGTSRLGRLQPRAEVSSVRGTSGSCRPSAPKRNRPCLRHRRSAPSDRLLLHNKIHITRATLVFVLEQHCQVSLA